MVVDQAPGKLDLFIDTVDLIYCQRLKCPAAWRTTNCILCCHLMPPFLLLFLKISMWR